MRTRIRRCRPLSTRVWAILLLVLAFGAYCYYYSSPSYNNKTGNSIAGSEDVDLKSPPFFRETLHQEKVPEEKCPALRDSAADIDTVQVYPSFEFQPGWVRTKEFWDRSFEERFEKIRNDTRRPRLKVIVVPHSHNDPGWLKTFEHYFELKTKNIINNMVHKLHQYPNMTFIWTEISFLNAWWETSHPVKQKALKKLIKEGRLEITTGGWVMPDEACTHIYSIIDQFIEGHNWVKQNLGIVPRTGWSIDPFGHGPTVPYLLDKSGLEGTIIQRIHYAWKQWLAERQIEEFYWIPGWSGQKPSLVVHNQPFDIYSIKSSCGPHPSICLSFDFRKIPGEYSEYTAKHEEITEKNLHSKSKTLIEEYDRIGSLTPHNVVLVPLGDDFRYEFAIEFDAQYTNYMKMFTYINNHKDLFNAEVQFGTPLDYFEAMKERHKNIPSLKGDFFVYSDIFSEGKPAYWSGYYTTRPYIKLLARQFEHQLRLSEILFTFVSNFVKQQNKVELEASGKRLEKYYEQLINARRNLGLFQHHDAITGTSRASVMYDYGAKMLTSLYHCIRLQEAALTTIMVPDHTMHSQNILQSELEWEAYGRPAKKLQITFLDKRKLILFNPLAETRTEVITVNCNTTNIRIYDTRRKQYVQYQISPNIEVRDDGRRVISDTSFDVMFVATLPPLATVTFDLEEHVNKSHHCVVFCSICMAEKTDIFPTRQMMPGDIQLENSVLKLLINRHTGFLKQIYRKDAKKKNVVEVQFGAYQSAQRHSGAYLFMPDYDAPEKNVLNGYATNLNKDDNIIIVSGPVSTEIITMYVPFLVHTVRIYNVNDPTLSRGVFMETTVDFESPPKNRETELFMRIQTDIQNGEVPEFYTDQNGFQYQKRVKVSKLGIEANYYPITTMAWLQDEETRLTLVTNHAQGAAGFEPGRLEVMLDRRTLYDDFRGVGEGIVDNKLTTFHHWLLLESMSEPARKKRDTSEKEFQSKNERHFSPDQKDTAYQLPSINAEYFSRSLNYPVNVYLLDTSEVGDVEVRSHLSFVRDFPPGLHLMTLRTITDDILEQFPSSSCYMVLQRPGYSCNVGDKSRNKSTAFTTTTAFTGLRIDNIASVSLTGLKTYQSLKSLSEIELEPMEVKTYKIGF
ncbi:alpha-mannosidase 2 isoform X2 [Pectinophora gossypiella]|uniref:alpha-mannosidase 2 isoform X2 n=1 Tax=Pectinophora gossypiella TaxID=13191 RepID=UPI00214F15D7|nr:alpha-mannosidase 2 isoform X2 [Pectinophora gossypiella]